MADGIFKVPFPTNEPIRNYAPGDEDRKRLKEELKRLKSEKIEIPLIIGGKEVRTGKTRKLVCPHDHGHVLAEFHMAGKKEIEAAIEAAKEAYHTWSRMDWHDRAAIFLKAAELLAGPWRYKLNAATMLNQSKNVFQAEIDSACELIDFLRFNVWYMQKIYEEQPPYSPVPTWNRVEYRPLEGFVLAVTPFNFTSIAGNLPTSPAMLGNVVLWKPASSAVYAPYFFMRLLQEAGLPDGVINFVPGPGNVVGEVALKHPELAGIHFTGSTATFQTMWRTVGANIERYRSYPRIVGETGGKDFIVVHASADPLETVTAITRGAFEYQGQKCSAASRCYIPRSRWDEYRRLIEEDVARIRMGDVEDFRNFMNAVIDRNAFESIKSYIEYARNSEEAEIVTGGGCDDSRGYFIEPTVILTTNPKFKTMQEEIFGPVVTIYVYEDSEWEKTLELCDETSPYGLTGAVFARDRAAIVQATEALRHAAGNFYVNDKPTGAVVGQQPFGGSRASGTNDKAGSHLNLIRWVTPRAVKENFLPPKDFSYPFMAEE